MKKSLFLGAIGALALGLASCSSEEPAIKGEIAQKDEIRYVRINIANPPASRAAEFQDGTDAENKVTSAYFKFYDAAGNLVGDTGDNGSIELTFEDATAGTTQPSSPNVGKIASAVVSVKIKKGDQMPAYVVAFLNPVSYSDIDSNAKMEDLRNEEREGFLSNEGDFAMTNSVYYGPDPISGAANVKRLGAAITADALFSTKEEAEAATEATVDIYVERYAAKVNFVLATGENVIVPQTVGDYTLTFVPEMWSVNADAPTMYASKRFEDTNAATNVIPSYGAVQNMLGTWTSWNDNALFRSYWACSPGYYADQFPTVSDDIIDIAPEGGTGAGEAITPYKLRYYSYNDMLPTSTSPGKGVADMNNGGANYKYVMENTMGAAAFNSLNPKAAAPSVVLLGGYTVTKGGQPITVGDGFCTYGGQLYWRTTNHGTDEGGKTILEALLAANQIISLSNTSNDMNLSLATDPIKNCFEVVHPSKAVRGTQSVPHRYVTLQIKADAPADVLAGLYYKPQGSNSWRPITPDLIDNINNLLWAQLGNARAYTQGKGYFSIPVQHLGYTENEAGEPTTDGVLDWAKVRVGDFGLVRNHVYTISVSGIQGMADGIENLNNPLVPAMDENEYWIKYRVNILNWRVVPTQGGIILK